MKCSKTCGDCKYRVKIESNVALGSDGEISSARPDCGEPIEIALRAGRAEPDENVVHLLVPAARWWDDIVFT